MILRHASGRTSDQSWSKLFKSFCVNAGGSWRALAKVYTTFFYHRGRGGVTIKLMGELRILYIKEFLLVKNLAICCVDDNPGECLAFGCCCCEPDLIFPDDR